MDMHPGQLAVPVQTVRALVAAQFPQWRALAVRRVASAGTVNALFRIGDGLAARLPLVPDGVEAARQRLEREAAAAAELLGRTPFPTPEPLALGEPGHGYPLPWSVQSWLPGADATRLSDPGTALARDVAAFVRAVRALDRRGRTFTGSGRGGDLTSSDASMEEYLGRSEGLLDVRRVRHLWGRLRELPRVAPDVMTHGDLMPGNLLVARGRLTGVLDVGGLGPADPALDLVVAWHLFETGPRRVFRAELGCDDLEWHRGAAWALQQATGLVRYYRDSNPVMSRTGRRTVERLLADDDLTSGGCRALP